MCIFLIHFYRKISIFHFCFLFHFQCFSFLFSWLLLVKTTGKFYFHYIDFKWCWYIIIFSIRKSFQQHKYEKNMHTNQNTKNKEIQADVLFNFHSYNILTVISYCSIHILFLFRVLVYIVWRICSLIWTSHMSCHDPRTPIA